MLVGKICYSRWWGCAYNGASLEKITLCMFVMNQMAKNDLNLN